MGMAVGVTPDSLRTLLARSVILPVVLMAAMAAAFLVQILSLLEASRWVDHTDRVIADANGLLRLLIDGETGLRGYLLTGVPHFLEPYEAEESAIGTSFEGLMRLVSDNPPQVAALQQLRVDHEGWREYARRMIALKKAGEDYLTPVRSGDGKRRMGALRRQVAAFIGVEDRLRTERIATVERSTRIVVGTSLAMAVSLGVALAIVTRRRLLRVTDAYRSALEEASRLAAIVESSEDAIYAMKLDGTLTSWNAGAQRLYGYRAEEAVGASVEMLRASGGASDPVGLLESIRRGERIDPFETFRRRRDGSTVEVSLSVSPVRDPAGSVVAASAIARDITEWRRATQVLERLARRLEALHEIDRAILRADSIDGLVGSALGRLPDFLPCDRAFLAMIDDGPSASIHGSSGRIGTRPLSDLPGLDAVRADSDAVALSEATLPFAETDGRAGFAAFPLRARGELRGVLYLAATGPDRIGAEGEQIVKEVADQLAIALQQARLLGELQRHAEELERRVEERTARLRDANEALEAFTYSTSHDLRAPLRAMHALAQALLEDYGDRLDDVGRDFARRIVASAHRMDALILDLLAYSRLSRGELRPQPVALDSLIADEVLKGLDEEIRARGASIATQRPFPDVMGNRLILGQVLTNLLSNALKFTAPGVPPRVTVRAEARDGRVRVWVEDQGIGIRPEHQGRIFEVFQRLHGFDEYPGTGIGLAIVQKAIERLGGRVGVESEEGRGSRFWVELPASGGGP